MSHSILFILYCIAFFSEIVEAHKKGKIGSVITVESGHSIGTSLAVLRNDLALTST